MNIFHLLKHRNHEHVFIAVPLTLQGLYWEEKPNKTLHSVRGIVKDIPKFKKVLSQMILLKERWK